MTGYKSEVAKRNFKSRSMLLAYIKLQLYIPKFAAIQYI